MVGTHCSINNFIVSNAFPHPQVRMPALDPSVSYSTGHQSNLIQEMDALQGEENAILLDVARLSISVADVYGNAVPIVARNRYLPMQTFSSQILDT
jgi:hypothetical protein